MLRMQNLLTAGLMGLLTVSGQSYAVAGGHHGGMGSGGSSGFHANQFSKNSSSPRPSFSVQSAVNHQVNNVMPLQTNHLKTLPVNTVRQNQGTHSFQFPANAQLGLSKGTLGSVTNNTIHKLPVLPVNTTGNSGIKFPGNINLGTITPIVNHPIKPVGPIAPVGPIKPICPPSGCGPGKYGNCWGTGCGFGYGCGWGYSGLGCGNWGCGNWGYGGYGCGYWPGYFGTTYNYNCVQPYPVSVSTPVYVTSTPVVIPAATNLVLNDTAVPPAPAALREIDLAVRGVQIVEAASVDHGALYRVTITNKGPADVDVPVRIAALGMKDNQPTEESPRVMESIKSLKVGESADVNLQMPAMANAFPKLLVAIEVPDNFKDRNEMDNVAAGEVAQLTRLASLAK